MEQLHARIKFLETELNEALFRHEEAISHQHYLEEKLDRVTKQLRAIKSSVEEQPTAAGVPVRGER